MEVSLRQFEPHGKILAHPRCGDSVRRLSLGFVFGLRHMKKTVLAWVLPSVLLFGALGRFIWITVLSASGRQFVTSPEKRYVADVSSRWRDDFWFGAPHDRHDIRILTSDGRNLRRLVMNDRSNAWPQECSIQWAADDSSVTLVFRREGLESGRLVIPLR